MENLKVISLGGSIIVPGEVDTDFLIKFYNLIDSYLSKNESHKLILVCGGGMPARKYQTAFRDIINNIPLINTKADQEDWIGIAATRLNGELLKQIFFKYCKNDVICDPTSNFKFNGRILLAAGWKPGFSTDYDAVWLATKFQANTVINLSNIAKVFTDDPKKNPDAKPLDHINWSDYIQIIGAEWVPGKNAPFDPIAAKLALERKIKVIIADGRNLENLDRILNDQHPDGTIIGPL